MLAGALTLAVTAANADQVQGRVVGVADGDTVTVLDDRKVQHKVRLAGIDAPEKGMPYGQRSKQYLSNLVFGKTVTLEGDKVDRYGRTVAKVLLNGRDVNLAQIAAGMAWHYKKYEREQSSNDRLLYGAEELDARAARRGLWGDPQPVAPWAWRAEKHGRE
ncbi:MAG: thermonuclease family protein [Burkholderiaceae bacterium]|nr:thermonuclease family protein [Burkholderiaceae bacterium]